jgi:hypothetical protein
MSGLNLSALAIRERAVTLFLLLAIAGAGAFAFTKLGRAEDPTFTVKVMRSGRVPALSRSRSRSAIGSRNGCRSSPIMTAPRPWCVPVSS